MPKLSTGYDCCGVAISEDDLAELRADMGVLNERRWQALDWEMPADEASPCWWIATVGGACFVVSAAHPRSRRHVVAFRCQECMRAR